MMDILSIFYWLLIDTGIVLPYLSSSPENRQRFAKKHDGYHQDCNDDKDWLESLLSWKHEPLICHLANMTLVHMLINLVLLEQHHSKMTSCGLR